MTIKEFFEKYANVEFPEEQEKQIKEYLGIKENKKWRPENNDDYFYISENSHVICSVFTDDYLDNNKFDINNVFKTKEDALFRLEQIKVYNELKNFADENNDLNFDLNNDDTEKYHIKYLIDKKILDIRILYILRDIGQIYFSSKELAEQAIEKVGADRIKKYLFGVV